MKVADYTLLAGLHERVSRFVIGEQITQENLLVRIGVL